MNTKFIKRTNDKILIKSRKNISVTTKELVENPETGVLEENYLQIFCPSDEILFADGWKVYTPPIIDPTTHKKSQFEIVQELVAKEYNTRTDISNNEAFEYMEIIYSWDKYLDKELTEGMIVTYDDKPWRVRQTHTAMEIYPPSLNTASLYEVINKEHEGTLEDPIPYTPPMELFEGKYYTEGNYLYKCIRNSDIALSHNLSDLVSIYVNKI